MVRYWCRRSINTLTKNEVLLEKTEDNKISLKTLEGDRIGNNDSKYLYFLYKNSSSTRNVGIEKEEEVYNFTLDCIKGEVQDYSYKILKYSDVFIDSKLDCLYIELSEKLNNDIFPKKRLMF